MAYKNKEDIKAYRVKHREKYKAYMREYNLRKKYGIGVEDYNKMLSEQGGHCALCERRPEDERYNTLNVDHDHRTGAIRGLLCWWCNHKTIGRHNDPEYFYRIYRYLSKTPDVPEVTR